MGVSIDNKFCSRCGASLQAGMLYCPRCGLAVPQPTPSQPSAATPPAGATPPPSDWREQRRLWRAERRAERYEKYEKGEKHAEKVEKGRGGGVMGPIIGGSILIWLGVTFYLEQIGYLPSADWWAYFLAGIGAIIIIQGLIGYAMYRVPYIGSFIGGAIILLIGLAFVSNLGNIWPLILVVIGVALLASSLTARRRRPPLPPAPS